METVAFLDLAPIIASVVGPMPVFVAASMRYQHLDSTKTRELTSRLIEESNRENRRLIEKNRDLIEQSKKETHDLIRASHAELGGSLADTRERLARIEGHLHISPPPRQGSPDGDGDAKAA